MTEGLLLIRRLRPIGEPTTLERLRESDASTVHGTSGAGRIIHALAAAGVTSDPVVQVVLPSDMEIAAIRALDLGLRFETAVLGSHLVNLPDDDRRSALLDLAARHLAPEGAVVVEHHPIDWAETAADVEPTPGAAIGMVDVRREPPFVAAVSVFDIGGRVVRQPFRARVLSDAELAAALAHVRLRVGRRLTDTLIEASPGS